MFVKGMVLVNLLVLPFVAATTVTENVGAVWAEKVVRLPVKAVMDLVDVKLMAATFATLMTALRVPANLAMEWIRSPIAEAQAYQLLAKTIALHAVLVPTLIDRLAVEE